MTPFIRFLLSQEVIIQIAFWLKDEFSSSSAKLVGHPSGLYCILNLLTSSGAWLHQSSSILLLPSTSPSLQALSSQHINTLKSFHPLKLKKKMVHNIFLLPYIHHWLLFNFFPSLSKLVKRGAYIYLLHFFTSQPSSCPPQGQPAAEGKQFLLLLVQCLSKTELCSFVLDSPGGLPNWISGVGGLAGLYSLGELLWLMLTKEQELPARPSTPASRMRLTSFPHTVFWCLFQRQN